MAFRDLAVMVLSNAAAGLVVGLIAYLLYVYTGHLLTEWLGPDEIEGPFGFTSRALGFPVGAIIGGLIGRFAWMFAGP